MRSATYLSIHDIKSCELTESRQGLASYTRTLRVLQNTPEGRGEHELQITLYAEKKEDLEFLKEA